MAVKKFSQDKTGFSILHNQKLDNFKIRSHHKKTT